MAHGSDGGNALADAVMMRIDDEPMITSTGSVETIGPYRWITLSGNHHLAHHVFPKVSQWWLTAADERVRDQSVRCYSGYVSFHRMVWRDTSNSSSPG